MAVLFINFLLFIIVGVLGDFLGSWSLLTAMFCFLHKWGLGAAKIT